jgi:LysM repeat protein
MRLISIVRGLPALRVCRQKSHLIMTALRFIALSTTCLALASCENMKKSGGTSSDPYASNYGNDGHYNPYPGQSGYASSSAPNYQTPPAPASLPPEPPANPYSFSATKKVTPSVASSSPKKSTSSGSTAKKKSTSSKIAAIKSSGSRYTVVKGDTLSAIARKKGSSVAKIKAANGLSGDLIRLGQSLKIP